MKPHLPCVTLLLLAVACGSPPQAAKEPDHKPPPQRKPEAEKVPDFVGVVSSKHAQVISADFEGKVLKLNMRNGQTVHAGDVVAELDDSSLKTKLAEAKGQLQRAKGQAARAGTAYANASRRAKLEKRLIISGAASREAFNSIKSEAGQYGAEGSAAAGDIATATATIADVEALIQKAKVTAPFDGTIAVVKVKQGETAAKGTPMARVFDPQQMVIRFAVPRKYASKIEVNKTHVELAPSLGGSPIPAIVTVQDDTADPAIDLTVFEAAIDPNIRIGEIRVGDNGHVRIAGAVR